MSPRGVIDWCVPLDLVVEGETAKAVRQFVDEWLLESRVFRVRIGEITRWEGQWEVQIDFTISATTRELAAKKANALFVALDIDAVIDPREVEEKAATLGRRRFLPSVGDLELRDQLKMRIAKVPEPGAGKSRKPGRG